MNRHIAQRQVKQRLSMIHHVRDVTKNVAKTSEKMVGETVQFQN